MCVTYVSQLQMQLTKSLCEVYNIHVVYAIAYHDTTEAVSHVAK